MMSIKLTIIIVNWNTGSLLEGCLSSFMTKDLGISYELIVVDNASNDDSLDVARKKFAFIQVIENRENVGFARANNQAIRRARGEYILLLNPDTIVPDISTFKRWTDFMDQHSDVGASGSKLVFPDGNHQVGDAGFKPTLASAFNFAFFLSKLFPNFCRGLFVGSDRIKAGMEVDWVCGAALMVRGAILPTTGLLDESIFMYAEDVEWGCRIDSFGYKVTYLPYLIIIHFQGMSQSKLPEKRQASLLWLENLRRLYGLYNPNWPLWCFDLVLSVGYLMRAVLYGLISFGERRKRRDLLIKARRMSQYGFYLLKSQFLPGSKPQRTASGGGRI